MPFPLTHLSCSTVLEPGFSDLWPPSPRIHHIPLTAYFPASCLASHYHTMPLFASAPVSFFFLSLIACSPSTLLLTHSSLFTAPHTSHPHHTGLISAFFYMLPLITPLRSSTSAHLSHSLTAHISPNSQSPSHHRTLPSCLFSAPAHSTLPASCFQLWSHPLDRKCITVVLYIYIHTHCNTVCYCARHINLFIDCQLHFPSYIL